MQRFFLMVLVITVLALGRPVTVAFQPPLTSVQAWLTTNGHSVSVHYRVYDPDLAVWKESQRHYDGNLSSFWVVQGLTSKDGVVAWRALSDGRLSAYDTEAAFAVYDPARAVWTDGRQSYAGDASSYWVISGFTTADGVVAWQATPTGPFASETVEVAYACYDPSRGAWRLGERAYPGSVASYWLVQDLTLASGIVAWRAVAGGTFATPDMEIRCVLYDPRPGMWAEDARTYDGTILDSWTNSSLTVADGLVAWKAELSGQSSRRASEVGYTIYDPSRATWKPGAQRYEGNSLNYWTVTNFTVASQRVQWTALHSSQSTNDVRGYDYVTGSWQAGPNTPLAWFNASALSGDAPLRVWLGDLSVGATAWSWDFGDSVTSQQQQPYHVFEQPGLFTVVQTVTGPGGTNVTGQTLTVYGPAALRFDPASARLTNGSFGVRLEGTSGRLPVVLWTSTNLVNWEAMLTNPPKPGAVEFTVPVPSSPPARFFHASEQP